VSALELDATLTAHAAPGLHQLLAVCAATGHKIAVINDLSEPALVVTWVAQTVGISASLS
jgi:hypothetical protein